MLSPTFLTPHYNLKKIIDDLERIKQRIFSAEKPFLSHHDLWEILQMMEIADKMDALLQMSFQTRSRKNKTAMMDEYHILKKSLKDYELPYKWGMLGEYELFL